MALFVSGELISVLRLLFVNMKQTGSLFEVLGQNTSVFLSLFNYPSVVRRNLWYLKHLRIDL